MPYGLFYQPYYSVDMVVIYAILKHDFNVCTYSTTVNGALKTQATGKMRM